MFCGVGVWLESLEGAWLVRRQAGMGDSNVIEG